MPIILQTLNISNVRTTSAKSINHYKAYLKFHWKTKKIFRFSWNFLKSGWHTSLGGFEWFLIFLILFKLKNLIFEMPIILQTWYINLLRTESAKSINLDTIRKLIKYSLKNVPVKAMFTLTIFEILLFRGRSELSPTQWSPVSEKVK